MLIDILIYSNKKYNIVNVFFFIKEIFNKCLVYMFYILEILLELDINGGIDIIFRCFYRFFLVLYGSFNNGFDVFFFRLFMVGKFLILVVGLFFGFMECFIVWCWWLILCVVEVILDIWIMFSLGYLLREVVYLWLFFYYMKK